MRLCVSVFQKLRCKGFGFSAASGRDVPFLSFMFGLPQHPVVHAVHSGVNLMAADARKVDLRGAYRSVSHALADKFNRLAVLQHQCRPCVARYIEYKNKTQEKCNYCTIYQCISGFYKKNVELHLLLILAIDSVIYSFYVTILLCKKAPVFD